MPQHSASVEVPRFRFTIDDFHKMGEVGILNEDVHVELIEGELIDMAPIGSLHASIVNELSRRLVLALGESAIVSSQNPIVLGDDSEPQPDIAILYPREHRYRTIHPRPTDILLLVEVADTTTHYDRTVKLPLYARYGIPEVWLVDVPQTCLETYHTPRDGTYTDTNVHHHGQISPVLLPKVLIDLGDLF